MQTNNISNPSSFDFLNKNCTTGQQDT